MQALQVSEYIAALMPHGVYSKICIDCLKTDKNNHPSHLTSVLWTGDNRFATLSTTVFIRTNETQEKMGHCWRKLKCNGFMIH